MKKKYLFLDDIRFPSDAFTYTNELMFLDEDWNIVRTYEQFIKWITNNGLPDMVSFDHDLADYHELKTVLDIEEWFDLDENREYTGMDCAKWLVDYCIDNNKKCPEFYCHSMNPVGKDNIEGLLSSFIKNF